MAHSKSSKKRIRQNEKRRLQNRSMKNRMRTAVKSLDKLVESEGGDPAAMEAAFREACAELDRAGQRRLIHPNAAARAKSRLAKRVAEAASPSAPAS